MGRPRKRRSSYDETNKKKGEIGQILLEERERRKKEQNRDRNVRDLCEEYMEVFAPHELKPSTMHVYDTNLKNHVLAALGDIKLKEIDNQILSVYFCRFYEDRPKIARNALHALSSVMNYGVRMGYLSRNPCNIVILPKKPLEEEKRRYLTMEEIGPFLELFREGETIDDLMLFLLLTGMRVGEACALRWRDIDLQRGEIHISRSVYYVSGEIIVGEPKSRSSKRNISIGGQILTLLRNRWIKVSAIMKDMKASGTPWAHPELVFSWHKGDYLYDAAVWHLMKKRVNGTRFSFMTPHCLRHTNATLLLNQGVDLKIVSEHLGHTSIRVTADVYTAVLKNSQKKATEVIETTIASVTEDPGW